MTSINSNTGDNIFIIPSPFKNSDSGEYDHAEHLL